MNYKLSFMTIFIQMVYTVLYCIHKDILYLNINDPRQTLSWNWIFLGLELYIEIINDLAFVFFHSQLLSRRLWKRKVDIIYCICIICYKYHFCQRQKDFLLSKWSQIILLPTEFMCYVRDNKVKRRYLLSFNGNKILLGNWKFSLERLEIIL